MSTEKLTDWLKKQLNLNTMLIGLNMWMLQQMYGNIQDSLKENKSGLDKQSEVIKAHEKRLDRKGLTDAYQNRNIKTLFERQMIDGYIEFNEYAP